MTQKKRLITLAAAGIAGWGLFTLRAQEAPVTSSSLELKKMSIEDLMKQEVISASRRPESVTKVAAAIDVIDSEEIRRSGATSIPDILRLATGLDVAQANGNSWAISARGFETTVANKMQVLMDGRSLYSPLFSGVFWDVQSYLIDDIDRIEVVRGPGATLWGANAFNGVINIITKSAKDTQGGLVTGGGGSEENGFGAIRYGGKFAAESYYRVYVNYYDREGLKYPNGDDSHDSVMMGKTGFRTDSYLQGENLLTVSGDYYEGVEGVDRAVDTSVRGANVIGRLTHTFSPTSDFSLQLYYDYTDREIPRQYFEDRSTYDLDFQHRFNVGDRNNFIYGFDYRLSSDDLKNPNPSVFEFDPAQRDIQLFSLFAQDEITLLPDLLGLTVGSKFENNDFNGFEVQPSIRLAYTPTEKQTIWAGISRAVRTPTRLDVDLSVATANLTNQPPENFHSEEVIAYELGYRVQPFKRVSLDVSTFYNSYDRLRTLEPQDNGVLVFRNELEGDGYGVELGAGYQALDFWRLRANYRYLKERLTPTANSVDARAAADEGSDPSNIANLISTLDLPGNVEFDQILRYVDDVPAPASVPSYLTLDLRVAWAPVRNLEFAVVGRNLLDSQHPEIGNPTVNRKEVERSIYGKVTWRF